MAVLAVSRRMGDERDRLRLDRLQARSAKPH